MDLRANHQSSPLIIVPLPIMSVAVQSLPDQAVVHAYRHLYRQGLKVIRYSTPGRHVLRSILQTSFRSAPREEFDSSKIANTLCFLERAAVVTGFEHKIVKNLLFARYWELPHIAKEARA